MPPQRASRAATTLIRQANNEPSPVGEGGFTSVARQRRMRCPAKGMKRQKVLQRVPLYGEACFCIADRLQHTSSTASGPPSPTGEGYRDVALASSHRQARADASATRAILSHRRAVPWCRRQAQANACCCLSQDKLTKSTPQRGGGTALAVGEESRASQCRGYVSS